MTTFYWPLAVANEFIAKSAPAGISHMKLQKLVYMTVEEWLKTHDKSFLSVEPEVWQYGPVFPELYHELKYYKATPIAELQKVFDAPPRVDDPHLLGTIDSVWKKYGSSSAVHLSDLTHRPGGPWHQIASKHSFSVPMGTSIPTSVIRKYVRDKASASA